MPAVALSPRVLAETLDGGQAFRWRWIPAAEAWEGIWDRCVCRLQAGSDGVLRYTVPVALSAGSGDVVARYLGAERSLDELTDRLPWRSDPVLAVALERWRGLRLLRQPFGETLFCFLCSATKQIVQIKQLAEAVASRFGPEIVAGVRGLPDWATLATEVSESDLRACGLGFRARYVKQTAAVIAADPDLLPRIEGTAYPEARALLMRLPGVGEKIADCVLLFGAGRWEAFPVDVWVLKAMARLYGLEGWAPPQVARFGRTHFGDLAGYAQQVLFAGERARGRRG